MSTAESKQNDITGHAYFKKINAFIKQHVHVGELYLEYIKGDCQQNSGVLCEFCTKFPPFRDSLHRVPRPKPDETALPDLKYLSFDETPITSPEGHSREIYDYQPTAQIKRHVKERKLTRKSWLVISRSIEIWKDKWTSCDWNLVPLVSCSYQTINIAIINHTFRRRGQASLFHHSNYSAINMQ